MRVSIVIPCYNVERYVADAVGCALRQTYDDLEVICVDDGSTDQTLAVLRKLERTAQGRMRVLSGPNRGASAARNRGLAEATGAFVQFLDADDLLHPDKIAHQMALVEAAPTQPALVVASCIRRLANGRELIINVESPDPWVALFKTRLGNTVSNLWNMSVVKAVGGWNETLRSSQEADLMFRILQHDDSRITFDKASLTTIRVREGSISNSNQEQNWERYIELRQGMLAYLREHQILTPAREAAAYEILFLAVRDLFQYNPTKAEAYFDRLLPADYSPDRYSRLYSWCFRILGFATTERLRSRLQAKA